MTRLSTVMALYNTPYDILKKTLESILKQSFQNFELIIVDDYSNIEYKNFLNNFNDKRIKYIRLDKNSGPGHARNVGVKTAIGEFIAIADSDDIQLTNRFELQIKYLEQNPDVALMSGAFKLSNSDRISYSPLNDEDIKLFLLFNSAIANPIAMFRKEIFIKNNLFYPEENNFAEDYELWINAMFKRIKMANLNEPLMIYTRSKNQLSKMKKQSQAEILKKIYKKIMKKLNINFSEEEINLHYRINCENYKDISALDVEKWFNKIIEANRINQFFEENLIIEKKNQIIKDIEKNKLKLFKIKLGKYTLCFNKNILKLITVIKN